MKKLLGILVLGLLLITNITQAKTIDAGNGITLDIPINYKYFEINYKKLKSLLVTFPNLKKQISSKDFKEGLKLFGVGNNSKLTILVENQEALKLVKKLSTSKGMAEILKEFETLISEPVNELVEKMLTPDNVKKLQRMSEKEVEKWFEKWFAEPDQAKIIDQASTDALMSLIAKYKLHKYALVITMDKKMDNDTYNDLQTIGTNQCVFDFKCKNNKDFQQSITKETSNFLKKSPMYKDYSFEFNISETGANSNNDLFLYMQAIMIDDYSDYNSKGELFVSTKNEKIIFAGSTCFKNCDDFLKIIYEIFEPKGLLAKKIEKKEKPEKKEKKVVKKKKEPSQTQEVVETTIGKKFVNIKFCKGDIMNDKPRLVELDGKNCRGYNNIKSSYIEYKNDPYQAQTFKTFCYRKQGEPSLFWWVASCAKLGPEWVNLKYTGSGDKFFYVSDETQNAKKETKKIAKKKEKKKVAKKENYFCKNKFTDYLLATHIIMEYRKCGTSWMGDDYIEVSQKDYIDWQINLYKKSPLYEYENKSSYISLIKSFKRMFTKADLNTKYLDNEVIKAFENKLDKKEILMALNIKKETKETDSKIQRAKDECKELGFTKGTEKFGDCVMKMLSM